MRKIVLCAEVIAVIALALTILSFIHNSNTGITIAIGLCLFSMLLLYIDILCDNVEAHNLLRKTYAVVQFYELRDKVISVILQKESSTDNNSEEYSPEQTIKRINEMVEVYETQINNLKLMKEKLDIINN